MIKDTETMFGPEPEEMGFIKNVFWGRIREDVVFPYPQQSADQKERTDKLLAELEDYLENEHPAIEIDQNQEIPEWGVSCRRPHE